MHRRNVLDLLERYGERYPDESATVHRVRTFIQEHPDCFERSCLVGHVTGSAWVVSSDHRHVLLTHHAKLDRWLQLGGHSDGQADPFQVALREAREESGMAEFREPSGEAAPIPLDLDVHRIPARGNEPEHFHYDVRYLLIAAPGQTPVATAESRALRWVPAGEIGRFSTEESLLRMARKAPGRFQKP